MTRPTVAALARRIRRGGLMVPLDRLVPTADERAALRRDVARMAPLYGIHETHRAILAAGVDSIIGKIEDRSAASIPEDIRLLVAAERAVTEFQHGRRGGRS